MDNRRKGVNEMSRNAVRQPDDEMRECVQNCAECHRVCLALVTYCVEMGGPHADPRHIGLLLDCVQICATSADFMIRGSSVHTVTCGACAKICNLCARSCETIGAGDRRMT